MDGVLDFVRLSSLVFHLLMWLIILVVIVVLFFVLVLMTMRMEDALEEPLVLMDGLSIRLF